MTDFGIAQFDGLWWPVQDTAARPVILRDCAPSIAALLPHIEGRDLILQAGANVGTYPLALADHFQQVVTCEPDITNHQCLVRNLVARDVHRRVSAFYTALGAEVGSCTPTEVEPNNCGAHRVTFHEDGGVPVITIDKMFAGAKACDCIWLDVEGSELFALQGAEQTIERFSPTIAVEDKGLDHEFFGMPRGALQAWLGERGYAEVARIGRDKVFTRSK